MILLFTKLILPSDPQLVTISQFNEEIHKTNATVKQLTNIIYWLRDLILAFDKFKSHKLNNCK